MGQLIELAKTDGKRCYTQPQVVRQVPEIIVDRAIAQDIQAGDPVILLLTAIVQEKDMIPDDPSSQPTSAIDIELYRNLKAGDRSALGILYDRYGKLVYGLALKILNNSQEAEDLTQEIFLALWRNDSYNPARGSLSNFLAMMTRSRAIDKLRSRNTSAKFLERWSKTITETSSNTPFEQASVAERAQEIRKALDKLPHEQRQILEMIYYEGLSQTEIARQLDIPLGTVKTRSRLGLLRLRQYLADFMS
jgi:RNA polymerase sigma-70 factor, ECF subfamily